MILGDEGLKGRVVLALEPQLAVHHAQRSEEQRRAVLEVLEPVGEEAVALGRGRARPGNDGAQQTAEGPMRQEGAALRAPPRGALQGGREQRELDALIPCGYVRCPVRIQEAHVVALHPIPP